MIEYKVGDIVEGTQTDRWVRGRIYEVEGYGNHCVVKVNVIESNDNISTTWSLMATNVKYAKNYIVTKILNDL